MNTLPAPSPDAQRASRALCALIADELRAQGGWLSFARYQELALYAPHLGYYAGGAHKFGDFDAGGDFVTAPELTPLFARALARQVGEVMRASAPVVLEVGAGSGRLAADLLAALDAAGQAPERYLILDLSGELNMRQRATVLQAVPQLAGRVEWLTTLPENFSGCIVANELLDALPVHCFATRKEGVVERGVGLTEAGFAWRERPLENASPLAAAVAALELPAAYASEIGLQARAWVAEWGRRLTCGALLLIDYGLPQRELYHPQRDGGSLRCHYRHHVHDNPFWWPGLSDITSHVDFTAIAESAHAAGLDVLGYSAQANFLMNCGIAELLAQSSSPKTHGAAQLLLAPGEMGELFKVIALGRNLNKPDLLGFARGNRVHAL